MYYIDTVRQSVRRIMRKIALAINSIGKGRITPNSVTITGLIAHIPIAVLIANNQHLVAALLLIIFGLFDTLDGELARLQNSASSAGMLLDATTDRIKEVALYTGIAYYATALHSASLATLAVVACGASLCVSYVKAKGESAVATSSKKPSHSTLNKLFADGLATFEVRIVLIITGLVFGQLFFSVALISILASYTVFYRLYKISRYLSS